jgi:hypothetical protein
MSKTHCFGGGFWHFFPKKIYPTHAKIPDFDDFGLCPVIFFGSKITRHEVLQLRQPFWSYPQNEFLPKKIRKDLWPLRFA